ncbi:MAG: hypothetical protein U0Q16_13980 [Bryobacteraceae bacterium]
MSHGVRRWLAPDVALVASFVTLLYCLFLFDGTRNLFRDSDTGWHIRNGETILSTGALPQTDPYSFTKGGEPWYAWEWASDALIGFVHRRTGPAGVAFFFAAAIATLTWLWFRLHWALGGDFLLACAMASPFLSTANIHWLARPHVFGWILLASWLLWLESKNARLWQAAVLCLIWTNAHASFFLQPLLLALRGPASWPLGAGLALVTLANPYFFNLHLHLWSYLTNVELLARIGEFQSFNFHSEGSAQIVATLALTAAGAVLALEQRRYRHAAMLALFWLIAIRSARGLPVLALLLPYANAAITRALGREPRFGSLLRYSAALRGIDSRFSGFFWILPVAGLAAIALAGPAARARSGFSPKDFPVQAAAAVDRLPLDARVLAPDKYGGYLIYRFEGRRKVFFDGRSDFYGAAFMKDYIALVQVRPGWERQLDRWRFTHALLPSDYALAAVLPLKGWREVYRDGTAVLLEASISRKP